MRRDNRKSDKRNRDRKERGDSQGFEREFGSGFRSSGFNDFRAPRPRTFDNGPRQMHQATCAECGSSCEVPFKPIEGRPVYCRQCFAKKRSEYH